MIEHGVEITFSPNDAWNLKLRPFLYQVLDRKGKVEKCDVVFCADQECFELLLSCWNNTDGHYWTYRRQE